ncbi:hypothetical protein [Haloferax sp. Atlit-47N]|uniref:hypothetical protein n=1 Tax=Haloferax sp. Atlit-47N TaxID=2077199 RepID=UPI0013140A4F|nr:hypothetical protein [Haloferax sp. Atlit-47N]
MKKHDIENRVEDLEESEESEKSIAELWAEVMAEADGREPPDVESTETTTDMSEILDE